MSFVLIVPTTGRVTSPFGERIHPISKKKSFHKGIDIAQPGRHEVVAAYKGTVVRTVTDSKFWGYGKTVIVRHRQGDIKFDTLYAHLDSVDVVLGQSVRQGQKLGLQGNTGNSTGQHLHFEVHIPEYAPYQPHVVDPMKYISWPYLKSIQSQLNKLGYKLIEDGIEGPKTIAAIKDFQKKSKIAVDGIAGLDTITALRLALEPKEEVKTLSDKYTVHEKLRPEYEEAKALGITDGTRPNDAPTRAETSVMALRVYKKLKEELEK